MTEGEAATNGENATNKDIQDIEAKIIRQVEYYFGDYNLPRDKFLQEEVSFLFSFDKYFSEFNSYT